MSYTNADGLYVKMFKDIGAVIPSGVTAQSPRSAMVIDLTLTSLGTTFGAANIIPDLPFIPAGSVIVGATLVMTSAATSSCAATLTIGTYNAAGTAIDADGIDATVAVAALGANAVVRCDGAQASGVLGYVTENAYVGSIYATAAYTAGAGKLIIEYVKV